MKENFGLAIDVKYVLHAVIICVALLANATQTLLFFGFVSFACGLCIGSENGTDICILGK